MKRHFVDENFDPMVDDPDNYKLGIIYFNPKDKRDVVPKRNRLLGLTFNFAHSYGYWWLMGIGAITIFAIIMSLLA
jgi:uncharacterized membrane protein